MISISQHLDCMIGLAAAPDKAFHLAYLDTQYGIGEDGKKSASRKTYVKQKSGNLINVMNKRRPEGWDKEIMSVAFWELVACKSEHQLIFGANYVAKNVSYMRIDWGIKPPRRNEYADFISRNPSGFIIWDKCNGGVDFADCELIWTSFNRPSFVKYFMWNGMLQGCDIENGTLQQGNKKKNQKRIQSAEKPIILNRWLLKTCAFSGANVVDTHSGSQALRIAAYEEGVNYTGYETDELNFKNANKRYQSYIKQQKLFV